MAKGKTLREKVESQFGDWTSTVQGLSIQELDAQILRYTKYREEIKESKTKDEQLLKTQELLKELSAPYKDAVKATELKTQYLIMLLGEKGGDTSGTAK